MVKILVVDDDPELREDLEWAASGRDRQVVTAASAKEAIQKLEDDDFDLVVTDLRMETQVAGLQILQFAKGKNAHTQVILCTAYGTVQVGLEAMQYGALDYVERNSPGIDYLAMIRQKIELAQRSREVEVLRQHHKILGPPRLHQTWPKVFVLMPFTPALQPVFEDHIARAVTTVGLDVKRADDFFSVKSVISDIWSAIHAASFVVADCTGRNPNVMYEIGLAHAIGRETILISQSIDDVPFDLRHLRIILYEFTPRGMIKFEGDLARTIAESSESRSPQARSGNASAS